MGLFRSTRPGFMPPDPPEIPMGEKQPSSSGLFGRFRKNMSHATPDEDSNVVHGQEQTTFLGRKISASIVSVEDRKKSIAHSEHDRNPSHLRMGESFDTGVPQSMIGGSYGLGLDDNSDDEGDEFQGAGARRNGKGKERLRDDDSQPQWPATFGWQPPKSQQALLREQRRREKQKRRHRAKRPMRDLDDNLDAFNEYAQNSIHKSRTFDSGLVASEKSLGLHPSEESLPSLFDNPGIVPAPKRLLDLDEDDLYTPNEKRWPKAVPIGDGFDALDVMADHIFRIGCHKKNWFKAPRMGAKGEHVGTGLTIRAKAGLYRTFPVGYTALDEFEQAMVVLNPEIGLKISSDVVSNIMDTYINPSIYMTELVIDDNTRIQVLDDVKALSRARKHQYAAFVRSEQVLCVWADHVESAIPAAEALEEALVRLIWKEPAEIMKLNRGMTEEDEEKSMLATEDRSYRSDDPEDVTIAKLQRRWRERPVMLWAPFSDGLTIMLCMVIVTLGIRTLVIEWVLDGKAMRFALAIFAFPLFWVASYACLCLIGSIFQIFGPVRQCTGNSKYFSGVAPKRTMGELSHVTVQMPVYKESLEEVLIPTIESLKRAITTYERQGGSVGILICDDGLQLLDKAEADKRRQYYFNNNIAYVARPGHGVDGFKRKGRFKKAGNMNFANALSLRVEEIMDDLRPQAQAEFDDTHFWCEEDEMQVYEQALEQAKQESEGKAWAAGNIRIGSIILIIDSDTRVPEDCFADAVSEMAESPEVAIIQHASGVMQVAHHFFENGIAFFTKSIQYSISFTCASGETAPFVGHNAFIRWSALQECLKVDQDDGVAKIWSESHVSEDFEISLNLQAKGYVTRWATYSNFEFEEGVSLTCDDELNRWQKYAFGCSELVFNPFRQWPTRGPLTPLFRRFLWTWEIPMHSKFSILSYIFSYLAISISWILTVANFFMVGMVLPIDQYYLPSWDITLVCIVLFIGVGNLALITLRYRLKIPDCSTMALQQIKWVPFFAIFFTGMSMPMSAAIVSHIVGYNMTWSTTVKTVEKSNFFLQLPIIWRRFYPQLVFFTLFTAAVIICSTSLMPSGLRVNNLEVFIPSGIVIGSHLLWPFALNPWFVSFSF